MQKEHRMKLFACRASKEFALKVAEHLGLELGSSDVLTFSDGEFQPSLNESVRGATVFIIQSTYPPTDTSSSFSSWLMRRRELQPTR